MEHAFRALIADKQEDRFFLGIKEITEDDLPEGEVTIRVSYSSINYKDGLACTPNGRIVSKYPFVPGIDLSGMVIASKDPRFHEGDPVIVTSYEMGVSHFGGFSEYARVPGDWVVPLPSGLSLREAMVYGTAGFTAGLSVFRLIHNGLRPDLGPVLVSGATGGVGSMAVSILAKLGYDVTASTGKESEHDYLKALGAKEIINREELTPDKIKPLDKMRWGGAVDPVGGKTLAYILSTLKYGCSAAVSGLTGGTELSTNVFPFILRGVNLLGIDSVYCPMDTRKQIWELLAGDWKQEQLFKSIGREIALEDVPEAAESILKGKIRGRTVVKV
ncbi:NADPH:quinone oxidoreductase family protein [Ferviditalea candida]|uniref:Acryloyl-CoA reductase n=1 Tax=Ferviditalea candida TaxID=3108399 RepID=A0ABU5ZIE1_9BACL|nr:acryloyl-CoA reductase [Paenibacillaceae bacterium T2]